MEQQGQIFTLIGKAIGMIGAIGKDKQAKDNAGRISYKFRGIDDVYNALNPVLAQLGIFFCPEVLEQNREERTTRSGAVLVYTTLKMRYTAYAPDGSSVTMTVVGEGMDSGDKSSNKAMSVAMKYAMFQLFCIPTEEMQDPDAEVHTDILPKNNVQSANVRPTQEKKGNTAVERVDEIPQAATTEPPQAPPTMETPGAYLKRTIEQMKSNIPDFNFMQARTDLIAAGRIKDIPSATITMEQAKKMITEIIGYYAERRTAS